MNRFNGNGKVRNVPHGTILDATGEPLNIRVPVDPMAQFSLGNTGYGQYGANVTKNSLAGWLFRGGDADLDIGSNVQVLRERSRDAFMGIPLGRGAVETLDTNVIGEGLFPSPNVDGELLGISEDATALLNKELAEKFSWWASDPRECDYEGKHAFPTLTSVAFQSMLLSGDCPVLFPLTQRPNTLFDFRLRILEADRVINPAFVDPTKNIYTGVELSDEGELIAYHIAKAHPLSTGINFNTMMSKSDTVRVEPYGSASGRRNMVFLIKPERPEQRRGVPILSVCLELLKQMGRYTDATVVAAVIQSYFTAFITSDFPDPTLFESLLTEEQKQELLNFNPYNVQLGPGIVNFMRPGNKVEFGTPTQPQATFGDFTIAVAKFIGSALGIPYEVLLKQYNASYSASRAALLDFWKRVRKYRSLMIDCFCQPAYEEWLMDAVMLGRLSFNADWTDPIVWRALKRCNWSGSSAGSLDPQKEVQAADDRVKCGFSTIERETVELTGSDYRDNIRQQSREQDEFNAANLAYPPYRDLPPPMEPVPPDGGPPITPTGRSKPPARAKARVHRNRHAELASGLSGRFER